MKSKDRHYTYHSIGEITLYEKHNIFVSVIDIRFARTPENYAKNYAAKYSVRKVYIKAIMWKRVAKVV